MISHPQDYSRIFRDAVTSFWQTRQAQGEKGIPDQGNRSQATGGRQMDGFAGTIGDLLVNAGLSRSLIHHARQMAATPQEQTGVELPGFYRATKKWDIVIATDGNLRAAIELKSLIGPSFGNNFNNRVEEAVGSAADIWRAYQEGVFRPSPQPWLGYLFLIEDSITSQRPVRIAEPHFPVLNEFQSTSYTGRAELLCLKLLRERQYNAVSFLVSNKDQSGAESNYTEPNIELSAEAFFVGLLNHLGLPQTNS